MDPDSPMQDHLDGFLKSLKGGDDGVLVNSPVRTLRQSIVAASYLIFENTKSSLFAMEFPT